MPRVPSAPQPAPESAPTGRIRRVVIVDDHRAIVGMIKAAVEALPGFRVVGQAVEAGEARELCRKEQPDVVVLDLVLPKASGLSLYGELRGLCPRTCFLIFSGHLRGAAVREALLGGVHGLVEKSAPFEEFQRALRAVGSGQVYFSRSASEVIRRIVNRAPGEPVRPPRLSEREKAVLRGVAEGLSSRAIAQGLGLSPHTVENHRARLARKTGVRGAAQMARYAVEAGLVAEPVAPE
jgi:DNA-binding NarL/FixJ family response regulator